MSVLLTYLSTTRISQPASLNKGKAGRQRAETSVDRLIWIFVAWKLVLLVVACLSPGPGYDTSTQILLDRHHNGSPMWFARAVEYVVLRLTRWDAIYFTTNAERGYVYEQQWAFSWLLSNITSLVARVFFSPLPLTPIVKNALAGILISHVSHFFAVTTLYHLIHTLVPSTEVRKRQLAFTTACLHILSPAGLFLSTPYGESTFALFNILGLLSYLLAIQNHHSTFADAYQLDAFWTLGAGTWFALATMIRGNGLLSGLVFAWDALTMLPRLHHIIRNRDKEELTRLSATVAAGTMMAIAFAAPQMLAYREYCTADTTRPWCSSIPPSIYSFVQAHYWNVGFLRYWTLANLPLFALAFPIGWLMTETAIPCLFQPHHINRIVNGSTSADQKLQPYPPVPATREEKVFQYVLPRFALPQVVLVGMAATSFHCQIINRLSSGYPTWYFILAIEICLNRWDGSKGRDGREGERKEGLFRLFGNHDRIPSARPEWIVKAMVGYAVVQGGLYAAFLPPA